jgi:hypothetical protein
MLQHLLTKNPKSTTFVSALSECAMVHTLDRANRTIDQLTLLLTLPPSSLPAGPHHINSRFRWLHSHSLELSVAPGLGCVLLEQGKTWLGEARSLMSSWTIGTGGWMVSAGPYQERSLEAAGRVPRFFALPACWPATSLPMGAISQQPYVQCTVCLALLSGVRS